MAKLARINKVIADSGHRDKLALATKEAVSNQHPHFFGGFPVSEELMNFCAGVQKAMPKVKFYPNTFAYYAVTINDENGVYQTTKQIRVCDEMFVYMEDVPFDLGRISYGDNSVKNGDRTYGVYSRKISNAKYALHRDQHHMIMTGDVGKAVKNACKYLTPYTNRELAQALYEPMHNKVAGVFEETKRKLSMITSSVRNSHMAIMQEVQYLKKQGVEFVTPEFRELAEVADEAMGAYKEQAERSVSAYFVRFKQVGDETYADVQEVHNIREIRWDAKMNTAETLSASYPINELPQDVAGQIAVLNILENDGYVAGVGMKVDDRTFWVERG